MNHKNGPNTFNKISSIECINEIRFYIPVSNEKSNMSLVTFTDYYKFYVMVFRCKERILHMEFDKFDSEFYGTTTNYLRLKEDWRDITVELIETFEYQQRVDQLKNYLLDLRRNRYVQ